jgi:hypothetical protein
MASWQPDPTKRHELRYFDGKTWTEHVSDNGITSTDPFITSPSTSPATTSLAGMQPTSKVVIWQGECKNLTSAATGGKVVQARYKLTEDGLYFDSGVLTSKEELIPLWAVLDVDIVQSITQKARGVGNCIVRLDTGIFNYGQSTVTLDSIEDPRGVRDLISSYANARRTEMLQYQQSLDIERRRAGATSFNMGNQVPPPKQESDADAVIQKLTELATLKEKGILTEEEFATQKARILGSS